MKYYLIAGERSGDMHGANLYKEIRKRDPEAVAMGIGGGYMHDARNYVFNVGFKSSLGQDVFTFRFVMDINGNLNNWQPTGSGS
jgi:hypothetical protein